MDKRSYFIKGRALFGSFPSHEDITQLELEGVKYFIDLTNGNERKTVPYITKNTYINYPILDHNTPKNIQTFALFIVKIVNILQNLKDGEKIYIHCKGGHGRSGVVVACLMCYIYGITPYEAITHTTDCHNLRTNMRDKWRRLGSPQTHTQKHCINQFFRPIYIRSDNIPPNSNYEDVKKIISENEELKLIIKTSYLRPIIGCSKDINFILAFIRHETNTI